MNYGYLTILAATVIAGCFSSIFSATVAASPAVVFVSSALVPSVTTLSFKASNTVATVSGTVNPNGGATTAWFEWGTGPNSYTARTADRPVGSGVVVSNVSQTVTGITAGLLYHGRIVASNSLGVAVGADVLFGAPLLVMNGAAAVTNAFNSPYVDSGASAQDGPVAIAAGAAHNLILHGNGTVAVWGSASDGLRTVPPAATNVMAIAAGRDHNLVLRKDGRVIAWGAGTNDTGVQPHYGQSIVPTGLSNVIAIAAGDFYSLALRNDGTVAAWGQNDTGQSSVPSGLSNVVSIAGGQYHSLALLRDGTVTAWGSTGFPLGVPPGLSNVTAIAAGSSHSLALRSNGTVIAWGYSNNGQTNVPAGLNPAVAVAGGDYHSLALRGDGTVLAWGAGNTPGGAFPNFGQSIVPSGLSNVIAIAAGGYHSLALRSDRTLAAWGNNNNGQTNIPSSTVYQSLAVATNGSVNPGGLGAYVLTYSVSNSLGGFSSVTRTVYVVPALPLVTTLPPSSISNTTFKLSGAVNPGGASIVAWFEWGLTRSSSSFRTPSFPLGSGGSITNFSQSVTGLVPGLIYRAWLVASNSAGVARGSDVTVVAPLVVLNGGSLVTNYLGEPYVEPGVSASQGVRAIASGELHSLALLQDGTVVGWGNNAYNQSAIPVGLSNIVAVAGGQNHSLALRSDGRVAVWGYSSYNITNVPADLSNAVAIAAGGNHNLALRANGTVAAWGEDSDGQSTVPIGLDNVVAIAAGSFHSLALRSDGSVMAWGRNDYQQSALPLLTDSVLAIAGGGFHNLALQRNGSVVAWGRGDFGQRTVGNSTDVVGVGAGTYHSLTVRSNGTVGAYGKGTEGQTVVPAGLGNVVAVAGGLYHSLALQSGGTLVAWGSGAATNLPGGLVRSLPVTTTGSVNTNSPGTYVLSYATTNGLGGVSSITRTVVVARPLPPAVVTLPAGGYTNGTIALNGNVNPNSALTRAYFRYGLTTNYGSFTSTNFLAATDSVIAISMALSNLPALTTYHFRLVGANSGGTNSGADFTFTTPAGPSITALSAAVLSTNTGNNLRTVQLSALVNPNGLSGTVSFQYGLSTNYLTATAPLALPASHNATNITALLTLDPGVTWHWRAVAANEIGSAASPDQSFTLAPLASGGLAGDLNGDGVVSQAELNAVYGNYLTNSPWLYMTNVAGLGGTNVTFALDNSISSLYSVQYSTDLVNWLTLGKASPRYLFTDTNAPAQPQRYYRLRYP